MIDPSSIDFLTLPWMPLNATAGFPAQPGIYFAIDSQGKVQYIGKSIDVRGRWKNHNRFEELDAIGGVRIFYLFVEAKDLLLEIESALIAWFDPPLNVLGREDSLSKPISVRLSKSHRAQLEAIAAETGEPLTILARRVLAEWLDQQATQAPEQESQPDRPTRRRRSAKSKSDNHQQFQVGQIIRNPAGWRGWITKLVDDGRAIVDWENQLNGDVIPLHMLSAGE